MQYFDPFYFFSLLLFLLSITHHSTRTLHPFSLFPTPLHRHSTPINAFLSTQFRCKRHISTFHTYDSVIPIIMCNIERSYCSAQQTNISPLKIRWMASMCDRIRIYYIIRSLPFDGIGNGAGHGQNGQPNMLAFRVRIVRKSNE